MYVSYCKQQMLQRSGPLGSETTYTSHVMQDVCGYMYLQKVLFASEGQLSITYNHTSYLLFPLCVFM